MEEQFEKALSLRKNKQYSEAIELFLGAESKNLNNPTFYFELALAYYYSGNLAKAIDAYKKNLLLAPGGLSSLINLGACYNETGQQNEAIACYEEALVQNPKSISAWGNLAKALHDANEHETAIYCYRQALKSQRRPADLRGLALAYRKCGRYDRSRELLEEALAINPNDERAHFGLAMNCLYQEEYEEGLKEYEWRKKLPRHKGFEQDLPQIFSKPEYQGQSLQGKTLLLYTEQGFGDSLQFCRFIPLVKKHAENIVMYCRKSLGSLFRLNFPGIEITEDPDDLPAFDYQLSVVSIPYFFDPTLELLKDPKPYIRAPRDSNVTLIPEKGKLNIGLVWGAEQLGYEYNNKKVPLDTLSPLFDLDGVAWHSLQVGGDSKDLKTFEKAHKIKDYSGLIKNFADTAKCIEALDLVISVDTSVAHLAGAMGKPLWVMLHKTADWRWHSDDGVGRWYKNSRLLRQKSMGKWIDVGNRLRNELLEIDSGVLKIRGWPIN